MAATKTSTLVRRQRPIISRRNCSNNANRPSKISQHKLDDIAYGFMGSQALFAALELKVFDSLSRLNNPDGQGGSNPCTLHNICGDLGMDLEAQSAKLEVLLDSLVKLQLISHDFGTNTFKNSDVCEKYLVSTSLQYYGDYYKIQISKLMYPRMGHLSEIMGLSPTNDPNDELLHKYTYSKWFDNLSNAQMYSLSQHNGSLGVGSLMAKKGLIDTGNGSRRNITLLDLGGGTGAVSIKLCAKYPDAITKAVVVDFPNVIETAKQHILPHLDSAVTSRLEYMHGNVLSYDTWAPKCAANGTNVVLLSYLLVSIPHTSFKKLFDNIRQVLVANQGKGGTGSNGKSQVIIHDFITVDDGSVDAEDNVDSEDKSGVLTSLWTLQHATVNPGVSLLKYEKIKHLLTECGFGNVQICPALSRLTMFITADVAPPATQQSKL